MPYQAAVAQLHRPIKSKPQFLDAVPSVLVQRELEFLPLGVSELKEASCQKGPGIRPRRFIAFVLIPEQAERAREKPARIDHGRQ